MKENSKNKKEFIKTNKVKMKKDFANFKETHK
jgi:hypothetical protein